MFIVGGMILVHRLLAEICMLLSFFAAMQTILLHSIPRTNFQHLKLKEGGDTPYSDIPEGCVLFGPQNARFFIFSDHLLSISHAMYLVSNKDALN